MLTTITGNQKQHGAAHKLQLIAQPFRRLKCEQNLNIILELLQFI